MTDEIPFWLRGPDARAPHVVAPEPPVNLWGEVLSEDAIIDAEVAALEADLAEDDPAPQSINGEVLVPWVRPVAEVLSGVDLSAFVEAYLHSEQGAQSVLIAGYKGENPHAMANVLIALPEVQAAVAQHQSDTLAREGMGPARLLREVGAIAFGNLEDFTKLNRNGERVVDLSKCTRDQLGAIKHLEVQELIVGDMPVKKTSLKLHDKLPALRLLAQVHKLVMKQVQVTVELKRPDNAQLSAAELEAELVKRGLPTRIFNEGFGHTCDAQ